MFNFCLSIKFLRIIQGFNVVEVVQIKFSLTFLAFLFLDIKMLEALTSCEPDSLDINTTLENTKHRTLSILSDLYDRELVGIIGWAKQIPGFTDLSLNDQMRLLQSTWAEILTLTLAFRSLPFAGQGRLKFATDFTMDEKQSRDCGATELYQMVGTFECEILQVLINVIEI